MQIKTDIISYWERITKCERSRGWVVKNIVYLRKRLIWTVNYSCNPISTFKNWLAYR